MKTYQSVSRLVLVQGAHSGPVEGLQQLDAGRVERVLTGHDAEEVRVALAGEHRVRVRVRQLQSNNHVSLLFPSRFLRLPPPFSLYVVTFAAIRFMAPNSNFL